MKGGGFLSSYGSLTARVFTSNAQIPLVGVAVAFTRPRADGTQALLAFRLTNYDGMAGPVAVEAPDQNGTTLASSGQNPYTRVDLLAAGRGFDRVSVRGAQVFSGVAAIQDMMLLPTPALPDSYSRTQTVIIPAQTL